jgi:putative ABC transport system ATP-binding protein
VLRSLYGVGTDVTISQLPTACSGGGTRFNFAGREAFRHGLRGRRPARARGAPGGSGGSGSINSSSFTVTGVNPSDDSLWPLSSGTITSGHDFTTAEPDSNVAVVDSNYAQAQNLKVGSAVTIAGKTFSVVGIVRPAEGESSADVYIPLVRAQALAKGRGVVHALRGVNVVIEDGGWLAIQGPAGHGKSTLLQILGALDRPTSGTVELDGHDLTALRESQLTKVRATSIGFVFQTFNLIPPCPPRKTSRPRWSRWTWMPGNGRSAPLRRWPRSGWAAGPAPALRAVRRPAAAGGDRAGPGQETGVLLADEPTGNLDEGTRDEIMSLLEELWRERGLTLVTVTHDSSVARRAQRTATMRNGLLTVRDSAPARRPAGPARQAGVQGR